MELNLKITGMLLIVLAAIHVIFPRRFEWKAQLSNLNLINRQLMYVHTFFIALVVFLMGLLCISSSHELVATELGRRIAFGLGIFWVCRLFFQFFVYSSELWKGKRFETGVHIAFSFLWAYFSFVFFWAYYLGNVAP
jgi:hypothetical protein